MIKIFGRNRIGQTLAGRALAIGLAAALGLAVAHDARAEEVLNVYSSRHYDSDEKIYEAFEQQTGIKVKRIEARADKLIARMKAEGANSPADILVTVDAGRIWRATNEDLFQPAESAELERRIPAHLRHPDKLWFGFSQRARIIFYSKERVEQPPITYEDLADPKYKGRICTRSSSNIYMISLLASMIEHHGQDGAKKWAEGLYANRARDPKGGDIDQLRAVISGQCDIVLANSYYFLRAMKRDVKGLSGEIDKIGWVFPNQSGRGAHVNISGAGVAKHAPHKANAIRFLEFLASDEMQKHFSNGNSEYPAVSGVGLSPEVARLGLFRADAINLSVLGLNQTKAQQVYDEVGYK